MFAVIKAGGKQYRVAEDQVLKVEGVQGEPGTIVQIGDVIMLGGDTPQLGSPMVEGASVAAEILSHAVENETLSRLLYIVLMTSIAAACAVASWHILEKRFLSLKKYFEISADLPLS